MIIGQSNNNSLWNKSDLLTHQIKDNIDILMVTETQLESFSISQFFINDISSSFHLDRNRNVVGILLYIREDIPSNVYL